MLIEVDSLEEATHTLMLNPHQGSRLSNKKMYDVRLKEDCYGTQYYVIDDTGGDNFGAFTVGEAKLYKLVLE